MIKKALATLLFFLLTACSGAASQPPITAYVDLSIRQPLPQPTGEVTPLRVAVASVVSPQGTVESYSLLLDYLSTHLSRPVELVQRRTYAEINDLVEHGEVDLAFVCTSAYIAGHDKFKMELLAAPQVNGETIYHSNLIVPAESRAQRMADLKGKVFAFTDPMSLSGRMYPTYLVQQLGTTPEKFFGRIFYTYSHDDAIYAVANKLADGAAVDSLVYQYALERDPALKNKVRIIEQSPAFGIPPVVVNPNLRPQLKAELLDLLLGMNQSSDGQKALQAIGVERFVPINDNAYEGVRSLLGEITAPGLP
ncbi:MAG: phosphate/phosphite/phosphonate ABC transporter substrate-binding protein [Anaerolineales bacterium]